MEMGPGTAWDHSWATPCATQPLRAPWQSHELSWGTSVPETPRGFAGPPSPLFIPCFPLFHRVLEGV